ncbi:hypothetical protein EVAR_76068_1 [Eumeta japonica]|uniref:Protein G12 n=1 Tax=Eumeta variegata TaxID=151549 RepID=A0A4C1W441_EUMVA|nr:hypothetical protein EVAR_76068_1 [Eumeta japonica]
MQKENLINRLYSDQPSRYQIPREIVADKAAYINGGTARVEVFWSGVTFRNMKVLAVLLSLAMAAHAQPAVPASGECQLQSDMQSLLVLIDTEAIAQALWSHLDDPDFQGVLAFIFSAEFRKLYLAIADQPELVEFLQWLEEQCVDVKQYLNRIRDYLELPPVPWNQMQRNVIASFWEALKEALNLIEMRLEAEKLYQNSLAFAEFVDTIRSPKFEELFRQLSANPTYQHAVSQLEANGIDVGLIREVLGALLGWG